MTERKNLCAHIPIALHEKVSAARAEAGLNTNDYVTQVLTEYYDWKENRGNVMERKTENTRTLAFQIPEELFQRIKEHLEIERVEARFLQGRNCKEGRALERAIERRDS